ncbi:hypothetical protein CMO83_02125 [Candidatus Woesearchaeota archaeon]|nr:hypothetical protein [Candidatus Woesearchaeota archaeon]|tara:strand:+ start:8302 stop:9390 length:1089 start_codon:yes stop_codon:yes gene_type:complete
MKNKKAALVYNWTLTITVIFLLAWTFLQFNSKFSKFELLGIKQISLFNSYQKGEQALFYIDQSAKYSAYQSVYDLGRRGGNSDSGPCGDYLGYTLWMTQTQDLGECFPDFNENFKAIFSDNLDVYLSNHPEVYFPSENYNIELKNKLDILGLAISDLEIPLGEIGAEIESSEIRDLLESEGRRAGLKVMPTSTTPGIEVSKEYRLKERNRPNGALVDTIVLHHTGDDAASKTINTLNKRGLGVHYIIDRDGTIYYAIDELKIAYHAKGWNSRSIGIEIVNTGRRSMDYTPAQYISIQNLINDIARRWPSIDINDRQVVGHYEVSTIGKWDPSPNFDWGEIGLSTHTTLLAQGKKAPGEFGYT